MSQAIRQYAGQPLRVYRDPSVIDFKRSWEHIGGDPEQPKKRSYKPRPRPKTKRVSLVRQKAEAALTELSQREGEITLQDFLDLSGVRVRWVYKTVDFRERLYDLIRSKMPEWYQQKYRGRRLITSDNCVSRTPQRVIKDQQNAEAALATLKTRAEQGIRPSIDEFCKLANVTRRWLNGHLHKDVCEQLNQLIQEFKDSHPELSGRKKCNSTD